MGETTVAAAMKEVGENERKGKEERECVCERERERERERELVCPEDGWSWVSSCNEIVNCLKERKGKENERLVEEKESWFTKDSWS